MDSWQRQIYERVKDFAVSQGIPKYPNTDPCKIGLFATEAYLLTTTIDDLTRQVGSLKKQLESEKNPAKKVCPHDC